MRRAPLLILVPLAALSFVACSDDDDDEPADTATDVTTEETTEETTSGESESDLTLPDEITIPDISISIPDISISIPDISIPDISIPDAEELIAEVFPELDEDQVSCLAEAFEGETPNVNQVMDLLDECNINPSDLVPG